MNWPQYVLFSNALQTGSLKRICPHLCPHLCCIWLNWLIGAKKIVLKGGFIFPKIGGKAFGGGQFLTFIVWSKSLACSVGVKRASGGGPQRSVRFPPHPHSVGEVTLWTMKVWERTFFAQCQNRKKMWCVIGIQLKVTNCLLLMWNSCWRWPYFLTSLAFCFQLLAASDAEILFYLS